MIPIWAKRYIGIPYKAKGTTIDALDCLGLIEVIYREIFNVILPKYNHVDTDDMQLAKDVLESNKPGWVKLDKPKENCVVLFRIADYPIHMGIVLDNNYMLHTLKGHNSAIERFTGAKWNKRIEGYYDYKGAQ